MSEHPILFSGPMVRAILDGRKTQTRRVIKHKELWDTEHEKCTRAEANAHNNRPLVMPHSDVPAAIDWLKANGRFKVGDRLWVREAFSAWFSGSHWYEWQREFRTNVYASNVFYRATHPYPDDDQKWVPSIFMPRWASRITLEISEVRVERLQAISEEDAIAEGIQVARVNIPCEEKGFCRGDPLESAVDKYAHLWDTINGKRPGCSWADNPWVFAITFKRV